MVQVRARGKEEDKMMALQKRRPPALALRGGASRKGAAVQGEPLSFMTRAPT
jgi:hypothetical protein